MTRIMGLCQPRPKKEQSPLKKRKKKYVSFDRQQQHIKKMTDRHKEEAERKVLKQLRESKKEEVRR